MAAIVTLKGGPGSGNWGHAGRPGKVGGSAPKSGIGAAMSIASGATAAERQSKTKRLSRIFRMTDKQKVDWVANHNRNIERIRDPAVRELGVLAPEEIIDSATDGNPLGLSVEEFCHNTFEFYDTDTGMHSIVKNVSLGVGKFEVSGIIYDRDDRHVGSFTRFIFPDGEVHNDFFTISESQRGTGFGSDFYRRSEAVLKKAGFKTITLYADIDVGGYAWARMGFDFQHGEHDPQLSYHVGRLKESIINHFNKQYISFGPSGATYTHVPHVAKAKNKEIRKVSKFKHTWQIAAYAAPDGERLGKKVLLGSSWDGVKYLNANAQTWRVGQHYYDNKDKLKK